MPIHTTSTPGQLVRHTQLIFEEFLTVFSATEIVERIDAGEWTASQVLEAYIARAALAQVETNCVTEGDTDTLGRTSNVLNEILVGT